MELLEFDGWSVTINQYISLNPEQNLYMYQNDENPDLFGTGPSLDACIEEILSTYYEKQEGW